MGFQLSKNITISLTLSISKGDEDQYPTWRAATIMRTKKKWGKEKKTSNKDNIVFFFTILYKESTAWTIRLHYTENHVIGTNSNFDFTIFFFMEKYT